MKRRRLLPTWLRRGFEAGVIGALLSATSLVAFQLSRPAPRLAIPHGLDGTLILTPAVLALGIFVVVYPTFLAATREEAVLGVVAAFLVAADALMVISFAQRESVVVHALDRSLPLGIVGVALAIPVAAIGLIVGPLLSPLGFGRSAGLRSAMAAAVLGLPVVLAAGFSL